MQNVVSLNMVIRRLESAKFSAQASGLTLWRFVMFSRKETIATDKLLISDEAVRVLDTRN